MKIPKERPRCRKDIELFMKRHGATVRQMWCSCSIFYTGGQILQLKRMLMLSGDTKGLTLTTKDMDCSFENNDMWSEKIERANKIKKEGKKNE